MSLLSILLAFIYSPDIQNVTLEGNFPPSDILVVHPVNDEGFPIDTIYINLDQNTPSHSITIPIDDQIFKQSSDLYLYLSLKTDQHLAISSISFENILQIRQPDLAQHLFPHLNCSEISSDDQFTYLRPLTDDHKLSFHFSFKGILSDHKGEFLSIHLFLEFFLIGIFSLIAIVAAWRAKTQKLLTFSASCLILTIPLGVQPAIYAMALLILTLLLYSIPKFKSPSPLRLSALPILLLSYFLLCLISSIWAPSPAKSFASIDTMLPFLAFPILFSIVEVKKSTFETLLKVFVASFLVLFIVSLSNYFLLNPTFTSDNLWESSKLFAPMLFLKPQFYHPSYQTLFALFAFISCIILVKRHQFPLLFLLIFAPIILFFVLISGSRSSLVVMAFVFFASTLYLLPLRNLHRTIIFISVGFLGLLALFLIPEIQNKFTDTLRLEMWSEAWNGFLQKPLSGHGFGSSKHLYETVLQEKFKDYYGFSPLIVNFHNQFLQDFYEFGLWGIIFWATFLFLMLWTFKNAPKNIGFPLFCFIISYLLFAGTECIFVLSKGATQIPFLICLCYNQIHFRQS